MFGGALLSTYPVDLVNDTRSEVLDVFEGSLVLLKAPDEVHNRSVLLVQLEAPFGDGRHLSLGTIAFYRVVFNLLLA